MTQTQTQRQAQTSTGEAAALLVLGVLVVSGHRTDGAARWRRTKAEWVGEGALVAAPFVSLFVSLPVGLLIAASVGASWNLWSTRSLSRYPEPRPPRPRR